MKKTDDLARNLSLFATEYHLFQISDGEYC